MTLSKGKIILIVVVLIAVAGIVTGTVLGIRNAKSDDVPTNSELTDTTTPETPSTPETPETPETPATPEIPVDSGTEEPEPEPPVIEEPEPEISEAEYYERNIELLKVALVEEYSKDNPKRTLILDENKIVINEETGEIYFIGETEGGAGPVNNLFFTAEFNNNILSQSQKEINEILKSKTYDINFTNIKSIRGNLSKEVYTEFSNYLLSQSYDFNGESVSFSKGAEVLDISQYIADYDAYGRTYIQFLVIDGSNIYTARLENAMPPTMGNIAIGQIMEYSNNVFKVTEVKDFKEFDYE